LPFALALPKWQYLCQSTAAWSRQEMMKRGSLRQNRDRWSLAGLARNLP
jgi:hypothetical protein